MEGGTVEPMVVCPGIRERVSRRHSLITGSLQGKYKRFESSRRIDRAKLQYIDRLWSFFLNFDQGILVLIQHVRPSVGPSQHRFVR